jgi:hypothetical protein
MMRIDEDAHENNRGEIKINASSVNKPRVNI